MGRGRGSQPERKEGVTGRPGDGGGRRDRLRRGAGVREEIFGPAEVGAGGGANWNFLWAHPSGSGVSSGRQWLRKWGVSSGPFSPPSAGPGEPGPGPGSCQKQPPPHPEVLEQTCSLVTNWLLWKMSPPVPLAQRLQGARGTSRGAAACPTEGGHQHPGSQRLLPPHGALPGSFTPGLSLHCGGPWAPPRKPGVAGAGWRAPAWARARGWKRAGGQETHLALQARPGPGGKWGEGAGPGKLPEGAGSPFPQAMGIP